MCVTGYFNILQSLLVANKATFRNCLVAMRPKSTTADLPSTHDISTYIHNAFIKFLDELKGQIQVSNTSMLSLLTLFMLLNIQAKTTGRVSATTDLWSVNQTKASFMGITAHWIQRKSPKTWSLCHAVIAFKCVVGSHNGENLAHYFVTLCKRAGILDSGNPKVSLFYFRNIYKTTNSGYTIAFLCNCR